MANLLDMLRGNVGDPYLVLENSRLSSELNEAFARIEEVEESLLEVADAFDNMGWSPMGFTEPQQINEIPLKTVKDVSQISRAALVNPFIKAAVGARIGYIWGNGVEFQNADDTTKELMRKNRDPLFSQAAYEEMERAAATDGNVFRALHRDDNTMIRVPLAQITGAISDPENPEKVWYYKREWTTKKKSRINIDEAEKEENHAKYYPSVEYAAYLEDNGQGLPKRWGKVGVDQDHVMQHTAFNKQIGWRWGVPDIMAVLYWVKAYKEYLEDNIKLVKAYTRIATQIKMGSQGGANSASAQIRTTPVIDPITGEASTAGATAITGLGTVMEATGLAGSEVNFENGNPLAAAIAAGMEVPIGAVLPLENADTGLNSTILKAMETRQSVWSIMFEDLFEFWGDSDVEVIWRNIDEDETHRRIQSVQIGYEGGLLHQEEARGEALELLRIAPTSTEMPIAPAIMAAEKAAEQEIAVAKASTVPGQGKSGAVGSVNSGRGQVKQAVKKSMNR